MPRHWLQMTEKAIDLLKDHETVSSYRWKAPLSINRITRQTPGGQIGETVALDEAVQIGMEYAKNMVIRW